MLAIAAPSTNLCLKNSLGDSPRPGVLLGPPHPEPKEAKPSDPPSSDTWFSYVLGSPEGLLWSPLCPPLKTQRVAKPRHSKLIGFPDKTASKPCREICPPPHLIPWPRAWEGKVGGVRSVESVPRWLCRLCGQLDTNYCGRPVEGGNRLTGRGN